MLKEKMKTKKPSLSMRQVSDTFSWGERLVTQEYDFPSISLDHVEVFTLSVPAPFPLEYFEAMAIPLGKI